MTQTIGMTCDAAWSGIHAINRDALVGFLYPALALASVDCVALFIEAPCGERAEYKTVDDIPYESVQCTCGRSDHWFIKYDSPPSEYEMLAECILSGQVSEAQIAEHLKDEVFASWYRNKYKYVK